MVTVGTVEELKRKAPRHVKVEFTARCPSSSSVPRRHGPFEHVDRSVFEVRGPARAALQALAAYPIHDVQEEPFRLEDYIVQFYASRES
jgi:hypothetical protein